MSRASALHDLGHLLAEGDEALALSFEVTGGTPVVLSSVSEVVIANDDLAPIAADDTLSTDEDTVLPADLFADNGFGADTDDQPIEVTALSGVNGPLVVGQVNVLGNGSSRCCQTDENQSPQGQ